MPANLNALIRYKTINSCLFGGRKKWTIRELGDACAEALAESRGRYDRVSERTTRDDIRIMRSDILGFNAPIKQERGMYYYSDSQYSILNLRITDAGLADKIYFFLLSLRSGTRHPELENILEQLCLLTKREYEKQEFPEEIPDDDTMPKIFLRRTSSEHRVLESATLSQEPIKKKVASRLSATPELITGTQLKKKFTWGIIIDTINREGFPGL